MSTIVTQNFKKELMIGTIRSINNTTENYYIGVSRSNPWNAADSAPTAKDNIRIQNEFRNGLQSIHRVAAASLVVPRKSWATGTTYVAYDDKKDLADYGSNFFYVANNNHDVYICLRQGTDATGSAVASTVQPTGSNNDPFETSDGYVWKFLYTISALDATLFMTNDHMPIDRILATDSNSTGNEIKQYEIQNTAKPGMITAFEVTAGGSGYTNPSVNINGVNYPTLVDFTLDSPSGTIVKAEYTPDSSGTTLNYVHGLRGAQITLTDSNGTNGEVRAVMSSGLGLGGDASSDLKCGSMMIGVRVDGNTSDWLLNQDYRQIGIIRGIKDSAQGTQWTNLTGGALQSMTLATQTVAFTTDEIIVGATSGAKAYVDQTNGNTILFHQNDSTGYVGFVANETLTEMSGPGQGTVGTPLIASEVDPFTGEILYIDNRSAVTRVANQTEDIKIVIQLDECS